MSLSVENCPCCGAPGQLKDVRGKIRRGWVGCPACSLYINWQIDPARAIAKWNKRAGVESSLVVSLTPSGVRLLTYMPEAVNSLAAKLDAKIEELVMYGSAEVDK